MFDFEKFEVYKKAKQLTKEISDLIAGIKGANSRIIDQLLRASLSIPFDNPWETIHIMQKCVMQKKKNAVAMLEK